MLGTFGVSAQETGMPYPKKQAIYANPTSSPENTSTTEGLPFPDRPRQERVNNSAIPVEDQIHSPIRWYALENADNPDYWTHVNTNRIWLELETGITLADSEIATFLETFGLAEPVQKSMHPHITNFFVFERPGTTAQEIITMAETAREVTGVSFLEPSVIYKGNVIPNDPLWSQQWGPYAIYATEAWDYGTQGANSWNVLGVVDDAIDWL